ncbi:hypothetical protein ABVK25_000493 [Lepraria finkii]|uniref:Uncharacterized protein n=1 Tax=Lepraria finkii TaxID=1340010 RepID=A0ABR4BN27_9LECA
MSKRASSDSESRQPFVEVENPSSPRNRQIFYQPSIKPFLPDVIGYQYPRLATSSNLPTILKLVSRVTTKVKRSGYHQSDVGSTSDLSCIMKSEFWCGKKVPGAASSSACNTTGELT